MIPLQLRLFAFLLLLLFTLTACSANGPEQAYVLPADSAQMGQPVSIAPNQSPSFITDGAMIQAAPENPLPSSLRRGESQLNFNQFIGSIAPPYSKKEPYYTETEWPNPKSYGHFVEILQGERSGEPREDAFLVNPMLMMELVSDSGFVYMYHQRLFANGSRLLLWQIPDIAYVEMTESGALINTDTLVNRSFDQSYAFLKTRVREIFPELDLGPCDYLYTCRKLRWGQGGYLTDAQYAQRQRQQNCHSVLFYHLYEDIPIEAAFWRGELEGVKAYLTAYGIPLLAAGWHDFEPEGESIEAMPVAAALDLASANHPNEQLTLLEAHLCYFNGEAPDTAGETFYLQWKITSDKYVDYVNCASGEVYCEQILQHTDTENASMESTASDTAYFTD